MGCSPSKSIHPLQEIYGVDAGSAGSDWYNDPDWEPWEKKLEKNSSHSTKSEEEDETICNAVAVLQKGKESSQSRDRGEEDETVQDLEVGEEDTISSIIDLASEEEIVYSVIDIASEEETARSVIVIDLESDEENLEKEVDLNPTDLQRDEVNSEPEEERHDNDSDKIINMDKIVPQRQKIRERHEERKKRKRKRRESHERRRQRKRKRRESHERRRQRKRKRRESHEERRQRKRKRRESHEERRQRKRKQREWKQSQEYKNSLPIARPESTLGVLGEDEQERQPSNDVYVAERIIARRTSEQGIKYFLIKWRGFSDDDNTWEPEENLVDCDCEDALRIFMLERRERKRMKRALWN